jgi:hypothetical protein
MTALADGEWALCWNLRETLRSVSTDFRVLLALTP